MTTADKLKVLRAMIGDTDDGNDVLYAYLQAAGDAVLNRRYPFGIPEGADVPEQYGYVQCRIACYMMNKRGAEGQNRHSENGVDRTYASADVPPAMVAEIVPLVGVV